MAATYVTTGDNESYCF